jgi:drug/metabolite transporter (DMT)-like permease
MALFLTGQQALLARYPAPMRVTLLSYAFGTAMLLAALLASGGAASPGDASAGDATAGGAAAALGRWQLPPHARGAVVYAGVVASGLNYVLLAWGNQQLGPATVSLYLPLQPLAAALLSRVFLGTPVGGAALGGGAAILAGLAAVAAGRAAARRADDRLEEKAAYLRSLEAGGGGAAGARTMVRSASAKLLREPDFEGRPDWA